MSISSPFDSFNSPILPIEIRINLGLKLCAHVYMLYLLKKSKHTNIFFTIKTKSTRSVNLNDCYVSFLKYDSLPHNFKRICEDIYICDNSVVYVGNELKICVEEKLEYHNICIPYDYYLTICLSGS